MNMHTNMDEKNVFQREVEVPQIVREKADAAFLAIKKEGWNDMKETKSVKRGKFVKVTAAAAACAAVLVAAYAANNFPGGARVSPADGPAAGQPGPEKAADGGETYPLEGKTDASGDANVIKAQTNFSLAAYAPESMKAGAEEGGLVFTDVGSGEGGFTGMLFQVQGEGIADVKMTIDKGELYTTTIEETTEDVIYDVAAAGMPDEDGDPDTHTVYSLIGDYDPDEKPEDHKPCKVIAYHCIKSGKEVSGAYDAGLYYGFYIPDDVTSSKYDLAEAYRERLGVFDGSVLTVSVTYTDGSSALKAYDLSVKKLALDAERNVTQTEWKEGDPDMQEGYVYGVMATEK